MMWQTAGYWGDYSGDGSGSGTGTGTGSGGSGSGGVSCQDCGNQAKKECEHKRCRTCCRSRGLPCKTHVKSTWVPAAKRRERDQQVSLTTQQRNSENQQYNVMIPNTSSGVCPTTHLHSTTSGFHFPAEVISSAVFQCVRVSGIDERNEQLAYQTSISVGGHVFSGILYDHGPEHGQYNRLVEQSSSITTTTINNASVNPVSHSSFMVGGKPFFPPPRS